LRTTAALEFPDDEEIVSRWSSIKVGKVKQVVVAVGEEESLVCGKSVDELKRGKCRSSPGVP
jgi:hypothetical protein